ncbi:MAG: divalent-cation tolerance protein CutA [Candidatus Latescibacterota bacterium]|nr:MAG: divalent-cation tolerance protein CutA [Candidatus Latescibacterota bacterium]
MNQRAYQIVFMTASNMDEAEGIAENLVEKRLAACVNLVPSCRSVYRWKGELVKDDEVMMFAKTSSENFAAIVEAVTKIHSYDVPEIIAADLSSLSDGYRAFLQEVLEE